MRSFWPIYKRELFAFFVTPLAWVLITSFLLVQGMHFFLIVDHFASQTAEASDRTPLQAVFGETVTFGRLLDAETDPKRRLTLLASNIDGAIAT